MKTARALFIIVFLACALVHAQDSPIRDGATEISVWSQGGSGLGHSSGSQMLAAGIRFGKILTRQHGPGVLRGNIEYAFDLIPLYLFFQDDPAPQRGRQTVYGGSISPVIAKWNFTRSQRIVPFVGVESGAIFTTRNIPAGDTSAVNFASGVSSGLQFLSCTKPSGSGHGLSFSGHLMHISNASIGNRNPGVNVGLQFRLAYQWWK